MDATFFIKNRQSLIRLTDKRIIVLAAYTSLQRSNDASFSFEQESNFWYLTGINHADWVIIIDGKENKSWLVAPKVNKTHQIFDGSLSWEDAKNISGVDEVISKTQANELLKDLSRKYREVYTLGADPRSKHYDFVVNPAQQKMTKHLKNIFKDVKDCRLELAKQRSIKQPAEIEAIEKAISLTVSAFLNVKNCLKSLHYEYQVEAEFSYIFKSDGAVGHAYDPIVASGNNAVTLHYNSNNQPIQQNSLLLLDIGARVGGYAADITRTYSVGEVGDRQAAIHAAVENAHHKIISLLRPGLNISTYHDSVDGVMKDALIGLGLLKTRSDNKTYRKYFPHAISHGLGIDVHDSLGGPEVFEAGMVLTVEPGIYIPEEGIGVRIEDDILITKSGHLNLSASLPTSL